MLVVLGKEMVVPCAVPDEPAAEDELAPPDEPLTPAAPAALVLPLDVESHPDSGMSKSESASDRSCT